MWGRLCSPPPGPGEAISPLGSRLGPTWLSNFSAQFLHVLHCTPQAPLGMTLGLLAGGQPSSPCGLESSSRPCAHGPERPRGTMPALILVTPSFANRITPLSKGEFWRISSEVSFRRFPSPGRLKITPWNKSGRNTSVCTFWNSTMLRVAQWPSLGLWPRPLLTEHFSDLCHLYTRQLIAQYVSRGSDFHHLVGTDRNAAWESLCLVPSCPDQHTVRGGQGQVHFAVFLRVENIRRGSQLLFSVVFNEGCV